MESNQEKVYRKCIDKLISVYFPKAERLEDWLCFKYADRKYFKSGRGGLSSLVSCIYADKSIYMEQAVGPVQYDILNPSVEIRPFGTMVGRVRYFIEGKYVSLKDLEIEFVRIYNRILDRNPASDKLRYQKDTYYIFLKNCWKDVLKSLSEEERLLLKGKPVQMKLNFNR